MRFHCITRRRPLRLALACAIAAAAAAAIVNAQSDSGFVPVTDAMLQNPAPEDWLMWRRTLDGWGYSPLDQITRENVDQLRLAWSRGLTAGMQQATPLAYRGVLYVPNPRDVIQAIDAVTGDLIWEHRRDLPDDVTQYVMPLETNRNLAIWENLIIDTSMDDYVFALDVETGKRVWETQILDYTVNPASQTSGPIIANGKVISGRSCQPKGGPDACVITAHDAETGRELWRRRTIPAPGEPGDETWGGVPFEERKHVGAWMVPSYDPDLNLVYIGTSVTSPAPKFMIGGTDNRHLYHNSTLALDADTGEIAWYYQHLNDHWDLDHPFERLLVDTAVAPDPSAVSWINPRVQPGERRKVLTGVPGKTGIVYTLDRETGEFLWATPTVTQNVISYIDGDTGAVTENTEVVLRDFGHEVLTCPSLAGGKDWEAGAYEPKSNTMFIPLRNACARVMASTEGGLGDLYALAARMQLAPGTEQLGSVHAISAWQALRVYLTANNGQRGGRQLMAALRRSGVTAVVLLALFLWVVVLTKRPGPLLQREVHHHRHDDRNGHAVQQRRGVLPLPHRSDRRLVQQRNRLQHLDVGHPAISADHGLEFDLALDTLRQGSRRIRRVYVPCFHRRLNVAANAHVGRRLNVATRLR